MIVKNDFLGEVEVQEEDIYTFEEGVYGFPGSRRFVFLGVMTEEFPFLWMQSLEEENAVFVVTNPFLFKEDYDFVLTDGVTESLDLKDIGEAAVYTMVIIPEAIRDVTTNLKAPIVINLRSKKGRQAILNEDYPYKFNIFGKSRDSSC